MARDVSTYIVGKKKKMIKKKYIQIMNALEPTYKMPNVKYSM